MLQIARVAQKALGDSADLVRDFLLRQITPGGGGADRAGRADLYYTIFVLAGLEALQAEIPAARIAPFVSGFADGEGLDFVHLGALARCTAAIAGPGAPPPVGSGTERAFRSAAILAELETFRTGDGGYDVKPGAPHGNAYGCFVALGAYQDLGADLPEPLRMVQCLKFLETPDGAWGNVRGMRKGTVPATAAAIALLHQLGMPISASAGDWLLAQTHSDGGWLAVPGAPLPDLLSTATALHALSCLDLPLPDALREKCLDFVDTLWSAEGGFHGHWADDALDAEYTFYGLLALGHLTV
jgi:prenyltransferase beta subunit